LFENILNQETTENLRDDIQKGTIAPAVLFSGPPYSGKGTAALEFARVLSCEGEKKGGWKCECPSCRQHRQLVSPDLLCFGQKQFYPEIAASLKAWCRETSSGGAKTLFVRSVRKLLARFSQVLWEGDAKFGKVAPLASSLDDALYEFESEPSAKKGEAVAAAAAKLESSKDFSKQVPVDQIRRASFWCHLAPAGLHKTVIIENADRMRDGAENALLKILEEPPERVTIVLTCARPGTLLPTIVSRVRQYRFVQRKPEQEIEVVKKIFRDESYSGEKNSDYSSRESFSLIQKYLESFIDIDGSLLKKLASNFLSTLNSAEALKETDSFSVPGTLAGFFRELYGQLSLSLRGGASSPEKTAALSQAGEKIKAAYIAADSYNYQPALVLDNLAAELKALSP
jgi:DNA polymerase-3 subunit gamma/tau